MALQKAKILANGAQGNYWKIIDINFDRSSMRLSCNIALFTSKDYGKKASLGLIKGFSFKVSKQQVAGDITALAYALIKAESSRQPSNSFDVIDTELAGAQDA